MVIINNGTLERLAKSQKRHAQNPSCSITVGKQHVIIIKESRLKKHITFENPKESLHLNELNTVPDNVCITK